MADSVLLVATPRVGRGTQKARQLRRQGQIPAVLYGHKEQVLSVALPLEELDRAIRHGVKVVDLKHDGKTEKAQISEVQWDHLGKEILHIDFKRVSADERIRVTIPVELRGIAPGAATGVLDQPLHTLHVECLALSVPDSVRVSIAELQLGQSIHVKDLHLPEGVVVMDDPDAIVVHIQIPVQEAAAPGTELPTSVEPEVIGRKPTEEEEEK